MSSPNPSPSVPSPTGPEFLLDGLDSDTASAPDGPSATSLLHKVASFAWSVPDSGSDACASRLAEFLMDYRGHSEKGEVLVTMRMLAEHFIFRSVQEGKTLFRHIDKADTVFVVASGTVIVSQVYPQPDRNPPTTPKDRGTVVP